MIEKAVNNYKSTKILLNISLFIWEVNYEK